MSGAFSLLEADEQMVRSLATGPEADGDPELPAAFAFDLETPRTYARIWRAAERKEFAGLTAVGTSNWRGWVCDGHATVFCLDFYLIFCQPTSAFVIIILFYFLGMDLILLV